MCRVVKKMSSSKRKLAAEKSAHDDKSKPSVFDRLGPGLPARASELEVIHWYYYCSLVCLIGLVLDCLPEQLNLR